MTTPLEPVEPPRQRYRTGAIGEAEARAALQMLKRHAWVGDNKRHRTRPAAAHQAKRLIEYLRELEPRVQFTSKTWQEGKRYRWAVRRKPTKGK